MAALQAGSKALASRVAHAFALVLIAAAFALLLAVDATAPVNHGLALFTVRNDHVQINEGRPVVHLGTYLISNTSLISWTRWFLVILGSV